MTTPTKKIRPPKIPTQTAGRRYKSFGIDHDTHARLEIKIPPPELIALREELTRHQDIYNYAIQGSTFEECCGRIAEKVDILLDGVYDGDKLCGVLLEALRNRGKNGNQPHLRAAGLVNVELVETKGAVTLEVVKEGTIAPTPVLQLESREYIYCYTEKEDAGSWCIFPYEVYLDDPELDAVLSNYKASISHVKIAHRLVHSFITNTKRRWDSVNGWTGTVKELPNL